MRVLGSGAGTTGRGVAGAPRIPALPASLRALALPPPSGVKAPFVLLHL